MGFAITILVFGSMVYLPIYYSNASSVQDTHPVFANRKLLLIWCLKGLLVPILIWTLMNVGTMPLMPPLSREIANMRAAGQVLEALGVQLLIGVFVIIPYWSSLTLAWCLVRLFNRVETRDELAVAFVLWTGFMLLMSMILVFVFGWGLCGLLTFAWMAPLAMYSLSCVDLRKPAPTYSTAIAKMKFGKYSEAEQHIISQLEGCESDFDGWMMLADLYANHFNDLPEAEKLLLDLCDQPTTTISQVSVALHKLADWYLLLQQEPASAKRVLEMICERMPGTHLATMATSRIKSLPANREEFVKTTSQRVFALPHHEDYIKDPGKMRVPVPSKTVTDEPLNHFNACVATLKTDPNNVPARERLAKVYVEELGRLEDGLEQLELLIDMPQQAEEKIPQWLLQMADWIGQYRGTGEEHQEMLMRLIRQYPASRQAFDAQRKLGLLQAQHRIEDAHRKKDRDAER